MKSFHLIVRRTHLYLGMLLIPWLLVYGISTLFLNHRETFQHLRPSDPQWEKIWEKTHPLSTPLRDDNLREVTGEILAAQDLEGPFGVQRQGQRLTINVQNFLAPLRLSYDLGSSRLVAEKKKFGWTELATRLHFRTGYRAGGLAAVWPLIVDLFCITMFLWILTGLILWWKIRQTRAWGWVALGAGFATFLILLLMV